MSTQAVPRGRPAAVKSISAVCVLFSFCISFFLFKTAFAAINGMVILFSISSILPEGLLIVFLVFKYCRFSIPEVAAVEDDDIRGATDTVVPPVEPEPVSEPEKCRTGCDIAARSKLLQPVIGELCSSISHNLSSTTEPISQELLRIKQTNESFLKNISSFESDVKDRAAIIRLHNETEVFNRDLQSLSGTVDDVFSTLEDRMAKLKTVSGHIGDIADDIGEISEQIRILSFNASIEAARAGNAGSGFRIIAGEIKRLSSDTENRLAQIRAMLAETHTIFENITAGFDTNRNKMLDVVAQRQTGFSIFEQTLEGYFPKLESLYNGVIAIINSLSKSMDVISPVVQLHEITSQEVGNLNLVAEDFCTYVEEKAVRACSESNAEPDTQEANTVAAEIRRRLTTENELRALGRGIKQTVPDAVIDLAINNRGIELF